MPSSGRVTELLARMGHGDRGAAEELLPLVYQELHAIAERSMKREDPGHPMHATDLLHEAYLKLVEPVDKSWNNRAHFLGVAAKAMRNVLVDHARGRDSQKRGGDRARITLDEALALFESEGPDLVLLDEALARLARLDEEMARIVELHFFGGLTFEEIAKIVSVPERTLYRQWWLARAWLRAEIEGAE